MSSSPLLSSSVGKRAVERLWLLSTPVWGIATAIIMIGGYAQRWNDAALMVFGGVIALGTIALPMIALPDEERALPWSWRASTQMATVIVVLAFGLNYFQTPFFFDVLHMHYGFHAAWVIDRNPVFLYLVTIPYFATYSVLACAAVRFVRRLPLSRVQGAIGIAIVPFAIAFLETLLNANPFMSALFCYDDTLLALSFGSLTYGISFVLALPLWLRLGESTRPLSLGAIALAAVLVVGADTAALFVVRHTLAPLVTTVHDAAAPNGGCLQP